MALKDNKQHTSSRSIKNIPENLSVLDKVINEVSSLRFKISLFFFIVNIPKHLMFL